MLTQMDPGGFSPPPAVNRICLMGPPGYMVNLEKAAHRSKPEQKKGKKGRSKAPAVVHV